MGYLMSKPSLWNSIRVTGVWTHDDVVMQRITQYDMGTPPGNDEVSLQECIASEVKYLDNIIFKKKTDINKTRWKIMFFLISKVNFE